MEQSFLSEEDEGRTYGKSDWRSRSLSTGSSTNPKEANKVEVLPNFFSMKGAKNTKK